MKREIGICEIKCLTKMTKKQKGLLKNIYGSSSVVQSSNLKLDIGLHFKSASELYTGGKSDFDGRHKALIAVLGFPQRLYNGSNSIRNNTSDISKTTCAHASDHSSMLYLSDITDITFSYHVKLLKLRLALKIIRNLKQYELMQETV